MKRLHQAWAAAAISFRDAHPVTDSSGGPLADKERGGYCYAALTRPALTSHAGVRMMRAPCVLPTIIQAIRGHLHLRNPTKLQRIDGNPTPDTRQHETAAKNWLYDIDSAEASIKMAGKKGENSKKVAGNARKADAAAKKNAAEEAQVAAVEEEKWQKGSKNNSKKEAEEAKKAEAARKKAEKDALMKEEEEAIGGRNEPKKSKAPAKKSRGLDLSQLDDGPSTLNASGIDNALDALSLTAGGGDGKVDAHPERRFAAAYRAYEERRLNEMKADGSGTGLRLEQRKQRIRKEFDKSPENPFNQVTVAYNATRDDIREVRESEKSKIEKRLGA
ncbi:hypothetical protein PWT90_01038 [Aphanocladium album]|nr:hypothetical protein PWT90_01038 [Aphanocladium album]